MFVKNKDNIQWTCEVLFQFMVRQTSSDISKKDSISKISRKGHLSKD